MSELEKYRGRDLMLLISPELLNDTELEQRLSRCTEIAWKDGQNGPICEWITKQDAEALLCAGWEVLDEWNEEARFSGTYA
ncbi:hypothetical protein LCGC14_1990960 [marine sediment metagenome]|uniref:Uncharacterized protein n=1 Tax=marine sediment metagenome TaxID=412755 RepID=A0A0F9HJG6_9ZZZZ